jgi:RimJ/RimL family protein N-acetyltransferase
MVAKRLSIAQSVSVPALSLRGRVVRLEPLSLEHVPALIAAATEDRSTYAFTLVPGDAEAMAAYVTTALAEQIEGRALPFATIVDDRVVGSTRFMDIDYWDTAAANGPRVPSVVEIGSTWLAASAQRTGANSEAKLLMLSHAFETWHVHRVTFKTDARNQRSRQAIERIGASFEGVRRAHHPTYDGTIRDSAYFSIIADEWPEVKRRLCALVDR